MDQAIPAAIEASAYFFIAEALTNAVKHSSASHVVVTSGIRDGSLNIEVRDDGVGRASPAPGTGSWV